MSKEFDGVLRYQEIAKSRDRERGYGLPQKERPPMNQPNPATESAEQPSLEEIIKAVKEVYPDAEECFYQRYGVPYRGIVTELTLAEQLHNGDVVPRELWCDAYNSLSKPTKQPQAGVDFPTGGDPTKWCECGHHEMNHAGYEGMPTSCNQTGCGCNELRLKPTEQPQAPQRSRLQDYDERWHDLTLAYPLNGSMCGCENRAGAALIERLDIVHVELTSVKAERDRLREAISDTDATLCACRYNSPIDCNCDIHAAHRMLRAALTPPPAKELP